MILDLTPIVIGIETLEANYSLNVISSVTRYLTSFDMTKPLAVKTQLSLNSFTEIHREDTELHGE